MRDSISFFVIGALIAFIVYLFIFTTGDEPVVEVADTQSDSEPPVRVGTARAQDAPEKTTNSNTSPPPRSRTSLEDIMRAHSDFGETVALYRLVDSAELPQVKTLLSEAQAISQPSQRYGAQTIIYQKYVELDPIAALESVQLNDPQGTGTLSVAVMRMWAEHDIEAAVAYVKELEGRSQQSAIQSLGYVARFGSIGSDGLALLKEEFDLNFDSQTSTSNISSSGELRSEFFALIEGEPSNTRRQKLTSVAWAWAVKDPYAVLDAVSSVSTELSGREKEMFLSQSLYQILRDDPKEAFQLATERVEPTIRRDVILSILRRWATDAPEEALSAANSFSPPSFVVSAQRAVFEGVASRQPRFILDRYSSIPESIRNRVVESALRTIGRRDPESLLTIAPQFIELSERSTAISRALQSLARHDVSQAMKWVDDHSSGRVKHRYFRTILRTHAEDDPHSALAQALSTSANEDYCPEYTVFSAALSHHGDIPLARRMISAIRIDEYRVEAVRELGMYLARDDPKDAVAISTQISKEDRPLYLLSVYRTWMRNDVSSAVENIRQTRQGFERDDLVCRMMFTARNSEERETLSTLLSSSITVEPLPTEGRTRRCGQRSKWN